MANDDPWDQVPAGPTGPIDAGKAVEAIKDLATDAALGAGERLMGYGAEHGSESAMELGEHLVDLADLRDRDGDGLNAAEEFDRGTDPTKADTDGDRLPDGAEVGIFASDQRSTDTDWDGRLDGDEAAAGGGVLFGRDGRAGYQDVPAVRSPNREGPAPRAERAAPEATSPSDSPGPITSPSQVDAAVLGDDVTGGDAVAMDLGRGPGTTIPTIDPRPAFEEPSQPAPDLQAPGREDPFSPADEPFVPEGVTFPDPPPEDPMPPEEFEPEGDFAPPVIDDGTAIADAEPPADDSFFA